MSDPARLRAFRFINVTRSCALRRRDLTFIGFPAASVIVTGISWLADLKAVNDHTNAIVVCRGPQKL
ncbi:MAG: hypothetical protein QOJ64_1131 [Acidobacteriota bacterium]|jgi:hypothetical protein|nr:hypothetical protein [Acidobacteriota bacterium]